MTTDQPTAAGPPPPVRAGSTDRPGPAGTLRTGQANRERMLTTVAVLAAVESTVGILVIALGTYLGAPVLIAVLGLKYVFCWGVVRRRPGAWMALLLWEISGVVAAMARHGLPMFERLGEMVVAVTCIVLLGAAASLFPSPTLPR